MTSNFAYRNSKFWETTTRLAGYPHSGPINITECKYEMVNTKNHPDYNFEVYIN